MIIAMSGWTIDDGFDLDAFLSAPLVARVATARPSVTPVWYLWEHHAFWWLTGGRSSLPALIERDPRVAMVVDTCDLGSGSVLQVVARGSAELLAFDADRARRWGRRYLGEDESHWGRFADGVFHDPSTRFVRLTPTTLRARDLSFEPATPRAVPSGSRRPGRSQARETPWHPAADGGDRQTSATGQVNGSGPIGRSSIGGSGPAGCDDP